MMLKKDIMLSYVVQILFSFSALVTTFLSYYDQLWMDVTLLLISATFITIGFNYYTIKNEKKMALIYFIMAVLVLVLQFTKVF